MDLLDRATNPRQYDLNDMAMQEEAGKPSTLYSSHWPYLEKYVLSWKGKNVLDLGAGIGWFTNTLLEYGVNALGVEPSSNNNEVAKRYFPEARIIQSSLEDFITEDKFDVITMLMAIQHIKNLDKGFKRLFDLLEIDGELLITIPDFEYFRQPRYDYELQIEEIDNDQYVAMGKRRWGNVADLVRRIKLYLSSAERAGFKLMEQIPMTPSKELMKVSERYRQFEGKPLTHLLRFTRQ